MLSYWSWALWGKLTPAWPHAHIVRPEQSNPWPGVAPAQTLGTPIWLSAACTATAPAELPAGAEAGTSVGVGGGGCETAAATVGAAARRAAARAAACACWICSCWATAAAS